MDSGAINGYGGSSPVPHLMSCEAEGQEYLGHLAVRQQNSVGSDTGGWGREALISPLPSYGWFLLLYKQGLGFNGHHGRVKLVMSITNVDGWELLMSQWHGSALPLRVDMEVHYGGPKLA